jgi:hypothetical protein
MANFFYRPTKLELHTTGINLATADLRALLVMSNSTAQQDFGAVNLTGGSGFAILDEMNGAGYARFTLTGKSVTTDSLTGDVVFTCNMIDWGATVSNGSRQIKGAVIYVNVGGNDATSKPLWWIDSVDGGIVFPYTPGGGPVRLTPGINGLYRGK